MRAMISFLCEVIFFNCRGCGAPIFTEKERTLGWCGCGMFVKKKPKSRAMLREMEKLFDDNYDPYGKVEAA